MENMVLYLKKVKLPLSHRFEEIKDFTEDLAAVQIGGKWGYINKDGKLIINPQYKSASWFFKGLAYVQTENEEGYIDKTGNFVWKKN